MPTIPFSLMRCTSVGCAVLLAFSACGRSSGLGSAGGGTLSDADYWTLLVNPAMWDDLGLSLEQRLKILDLSGGAMNLQFGHGDNVEWIVSRTSARGKEVRELLTPAQDATFRDLFASERMPHVTVTEHKGEVIRLRIHYGTYKNITADAYWENRAKELSKRPSPWRDAKEWAECGARSPSMQIATIPEALSLVGSKDPQIAIVARTWLEKAAPTDADRPAMLAYFRAQLFPLEAHDFPDSIRTLECYFDWATRDQLGDMLAVINGPLRPATGNRSHRVGWLALYLKANDVFRREYAARRVDPDQRAILTDAFATWASNGAPHIQAAGKQMRADLEAFLKDPRNAQAIADAKAAKEKRELDRTAPARAAAEAKMKADREAREKAASQAAADTASKSLSSPDSANWGKGFQALARAAVTDPADRKTLRAGLLAIVAQTKDQRARRDALPHLNKYADPADIPALAAIVNADDKSAEHLRGPIMALILHLDPAKGLPIVESRAAYQVELNETAMTLASEWKANAFPAAKVLFTSSKPAVRKAAVHALAESDKPAARTFLLAAQKTEKDPAVLDAIQIYLSRLK